MRATIVDLRYRMKDVLGALDRGETVIVLHRGKERAKLTPTSPGPDERQEVARTKDEPLFGLWTDRKDLDDPDSYLRKLRQARPFSAKKADRRSVRKRRK